MDKEISDHIIELTCSENQLTSLSNLPLCRILYCYDNRISLDKDEWNLIWFYREQLLCKRFIKNGINYFLSHIVLRRQIYI